MIVIILTCGHMFLKSKEIGAKKMLVDDKIKSTACVKEMSSGCCMQSLEKCLEFLNILLSLITFAINIKFCVSSKLLVFFYKLPTTNFLRMYCYSPVIALVNFVKLAPVTVVTVSCLQWKTTSNTYHFCDIAHILLTWKGHKPITVK